MLNLGQSIYVRARCVRRVRFISLFQSLYSVIPVTRRSVKTGLRVELRVELRVCGIEP